MDFCINCNIATNRCNTVGSRTLEDEAILTVIRQWRGAHINSSDNICHACFNLAQDVISERQSLDAGRRRSIRNLCLRCRRSLNNQRVRHLLNRNSAREMRIYNVVQQWILPQTIEEDSHICHSCWVAADRAAQRTLPSTSNDINENLPVEPMEPVEPVEPVEDSQNDPPVLENIEGTREPEPTILLPDYVRAVETESKCFFQDCRGTERHRIPVSLRKVLLNNYNYYVPDKNRLCSQHMISETWDFLGHSRNNYVHSFNAKHIQDMLSLKEVSTSAGLDFENIDEMEDHVVHIWIGFNKAQFNQMLNSLPQLSEIHRGSVALAAYLMKLRTGESNERLSTLLKISRRTLERWLEKIRNMLLEYFVPRHLGLSHITRDEVTARNLAIPNALFGNYNGINMPIAIFDGTYCYIEKSSNYLYQKRTYSLHKYRNLIKPFLIVCTDGHIIDVLGPYPATTSDANIMIKEFQDNSPLEAFFNEGDAFILDRGFRDSLPLLNHRGYRTYVPASLEEGETQLSTSEANKSRAVTICRWVVEVVNGRFKRDFKLLRQNYFNVANKHFMADFKVAAALINKFHPPIVDRVDAAEIIEQINIYMETHNYLADFVVSNNYNRRRADFVTITLPTEDLSEFPQLTYNDLILISLGTYQLKQARSYFGEHVRANEGFVIEVCREVNSGQLQELSTSNTSWLLRGRIMSRHISRKTYFVYILVDSSLMGRESIVQHFCNCIVGRRTVGCCAHIMTIIWYLGWARYQNNIIPPAQFLDNILIIIDDE